MTPQNCTLCQGDDTDDVALMEDYYRAVGEPDWVELRREHDAKTVVEIKAHVTSHVGQDARAEAGQEVLFE